MSFILDALKKSEAERHRQAGPTLYEMRAAPRRTPLPRWVVVILIVLGLNLLALGYLLLRKPAAPVSVPAASNTAAVAAAAPPATVAPTPALPKPASTLAPLSIKPAEEEAPVAAPASPAPSVASAAPKATRPPEGPVASMADMAASGANLPALHLSLHAYDAEGSRRFVLLNGLRLREGEATGEGVRVERIVEEGAVLSWHGRRFMLPRGE